MIDLEITILHDGRLRLVADPHDRAEIKARLETEGFWAAFESALESHWGNGQYHPFYPAHGNPFVGLTGALCIAEEMWFGENGENEVIGRLWYFNRYQLECPLETLVNEGEVIFDLA